MGRTSGMHIQDGGLRAQGSLPNQYVGLYVQNVPLMCCWRGGGPCCCERAHSCGEICSSASFNWDLGLSFCEADAVNQSQGPVGDLGRPANSI
jgi:hypothetical protein